METLLTPEFVERRISTLPTLIEGWGVKHSTHYYQLDLKMCRVKTLAYSFEWGKEIVPQPRLVSVLEMPSRILRMDLGLNELVSLSHDGLLPFRNLRSLDASLNQISSFQGIEVLRHLYSLNLSHNFIKRVDGLANSIALVELNLSMNEIEDISAMPSLINLRVLNISNNKLMSLEGISALSKLEELYVQRNKLYDIVPVTSLFHIRVLNAADNNIMNFDDVLRVLQKVKWLQVLCLHGNPIDRERHYEADILRASNVMTLDNVSVRPLPKKSIDNRRHTDNILTLKDAAKQAFEERMKVSRNEMEENVNFLQRRILSLQDEHKDFEQKMRNDLEVCSRYLDSLTSGEIGYVEKNALRFPPGTPIPWDMQSLAPSRAEGKKDYSNVKDTDELLTCAYMELARDKDNLGHI
ncbi:protein phosphatase 1 regulatory subunit 7-like [Gigantopelta aegis]|uniref:protein phosphatase 1 regulatory subunit 7-like n=1 Tax=Gigantopelta aegis TaxID=1735272 RepID=UPI001B888475|nr:protein phosphatase 1 regulatory subunit 7-like [Gigantopelta aegis]